MEKIQKIFKCLCGLEGIIIEKLEDNEICLSCYLGSGFYTKQTLIRQFFERFKIAWNIIIKGEYKFYWIKKLRMDYQKN